MKRLLWLALLAACATNGKPVPAPSLEWRPETYVCYRTPAELRIDGRLDEEAWQKAPWTKDFIDIEGARKPRPRHRTRVKMLWDDEYFYIGAELTEPHVWATLKERDSVIFHDNDFEVFIDPNGDTHEYYELEINAFGTEWDLFLVKPYRDGGPPVHDWNILGLKSAVAVDGTINDPSDVDGGWSVEIAMPWRSLREAAQRPSPPQPGHQWWVNFSRVQWRTRVDEGKYVKLVDEKTGKPLPEDNWVWSPQGLVNMHYPEMWGLVQFSAKDAGTRRELVALDPENAVRWELRRLYYAGKVPATRGGFAITRDGRILRRP